MMGPKREENKNVTHGGVLTSQKYVTRELVSFLCYTLHTCSVIGTKSEQDSYFICKNFSHSICNRVYERVLTGELTQEASSVIDYLVILLSEADRKQCIFY